MTKAGDLAPVVPSHVPPLFGGSVMSEPTVEFDVHAVGLDEYVEILGSGVPSTSLSPPRRKLVFATKLRIAQLQGGVRSGGDIGQCVQDDAPPSGAGRSVKCVTQPLRTCSPRSDRVPD